MPGAWQTCSPNRQYRAHTTGSPCRNRPGPNRWTKISPKIGTRELPPGGAGPHKCPVGQGSSAGILLPQQGTLYSSGNGGDTRLQVPQVTQRASSRQQSQERRRAGPQRPGKWPVCTQGPGALEAGGKSVGRGALESPTPVGAPGQGAPAVRKDRG